MRRWMKVVFCFLFGIIFTNMFTMDQAVADESFGKREISAESSVLTQKKQAVLDMETMTFSLESEADEDGDTISKGMILTTAGITSDTYPAVLTKSERLEEKELWENGIRINIVWKTVCLGSSVLQMEELCSWRQLLH